MSLGDMAFGYASILGVEAKLAKKGTKLLEIADALVMRAVVRDLVVHIKDVKVTERN